MPRWPRGLNWRACSRKLLRAVRYLWYAGDLGLKQGGFFDHFDGKPGFRPLSCKDLHVFPGPVQKRQNSNCFSSPSFSAFYLLLYFTGGGPFYRNSDPYFLIASLLFRSKTQKFYQKLDIQAFLFYTHYVKNDIILARDIKAKEAILFLTWTSQFHKSWDFKMTPSKH